MNEGASWISCPACSTTGGMSVKASATTRPNTEREMMAMASERFTPRRSRTTTGWSSATAIITAVPISVSETIARAAPSTIAATSSTPKQTVITVLTVTCEGRNSGLGSVKGGPCSLSPSIYPGRRFTQAVELPEAGLGARQLGEDGGAILGPGDEGLARRGLRRPGRVGPEQRALQMDPGLVEALELAVGAAHQKVGEPPARIVAQAPLQQSDGLVQPAVPPGDGGEARDRQREGAVLQRRLFVVVSSLGGATGGLGQLSEPLLRGAESGGDGAGSLEGGRRSGFVAAAEEPHAALVGRLAGEGIALLRASQRPQRDLVV